MNVYTNILAKKWNFKKLRHNFVDERAVITTPLISFCLLKKRPENAFSTLIVNYRKTVQKKRIMLSKTATNWLFNDIWCYLLIACFDWISACHKTKIRNETIFTTFNWWKAAWSCWYCFNYIKSTYKLLLLNGVVA